MVETKEKNGAFYFCRQHEDTTRMTKYQKKTLNTLPFSTSYFLIAKKFNFYVSIYISIRLTSKKSWKKVNMYSSNYIFFKQTILQKNNQLWYHFSCIITANFFL